MHFTLFHENLNFITSRTFHESNTKHIDNHDCFGNSRSCIVSAFWTTIQDRKMKPVESLEKHIFNSKETASSSRRNQLEASDSQKKRKSKKQTQRDDTLEKLWRHKTEKVRNVSQTRGIHHNKHKNITSKKTKHRVEARSRGCNTHVDEFVHTAPTWLLQASRQWKWCFFPWKLLLREDEYKTSCLMIRKRHGI